MGLGIEPYLRKLYIPIAKLTPYKLIELPCSLGKLILRKGLVDPFYGPVKLCDYSEVLRPRRGAVGKVGKKVLIKVHKYKPSRIPELVGKVLIALKTLF